MIRKGNNLAATPRQAAKTVLRVVPLVMRTVRAELRACRGTTLSVPQFRALIFVDLHPGSSLSAVAAHMGVTLASASRLIDGLVARKLLIRQEHPADRRRLTLQLTERGRTLLRTAHAFTESSLASRLSALGGADLAAVVGAMEMMHPVFAATAAPAEERKPRLARRRAGVHP